MRKILLYVTVCLMTCGLVNKASAGCNAANATNGKLEVKVNGTIIPENKLVYITKVPKMPTMSAQLTGSPSGNLLWTASYEFTKSGHQKTETTTLAASKSCDILELLGGGFFGGEITVQLEDDDGKTCSFTFHIRGNNPDDNVVENYIGTSPWYAIPIAKKESKLDYNGSYEYYCQFNRTDRWPPSATSETGACPNFGTPNGWGIMQVDPPPNNEVLWNWKANIDEGKSIIADYSNKADRWMNDPTWHGFPCSNLPGQRVQAKTWNGGMAVPVPDEPVGNVTFKDGTSKPIEHAVAIKLYNGATRNYCSWSGTAWAFNRYSTVIVNGVARQLNYVQEICNHY